MFDLHCHILPGIDDGAGSWEESLEMARISLEAGVKTIVATPHYSPETNPAAIIELVKQLNCRLRECDLGIDVIPGMEAYLDPDLPQLLRDGRVLTIGNYLLMELPFSSLPLYTDDVLFQVMMTGYRVILAHPERNNEVMQNPGLVYEWVSRGILVQVNSGSLLGKFGSTVQRTASALFKANLVHFLGSDAHSPLRRRPDMGEAAALLRSRAANARDIYEVNGQNLLLGSFRPNQDFELPDLMRQPWWKRLWGV